MTIAQLFLVKAINLPRAISRRPTATLSAVARETTLRAIEVGSQGEVAGYWVTPKKGARGFIPASAVAYVVTLEVPKVELAPTPPPVDEEGGEDPAPTPAPLNPHVEPEKHADDLASQSVKDLRKMAAKLGISSDKLRKEALVAAIAEAQG